MINHRSNNKKVAVVGLGRIGLPFALYVATKGFSVYGIDVNERLVKQYKKGRIPFRVGISSHDFRRLLGRRFYPSVDYARASEADYIVIAVGTPSEADDDGEAVRSVIINSLSPYLVRGQCIVVRSTVSPGTIRALGRLMRRHTKLRVGSDIFLAYCPERSLEGRVLEELPITPQLIGADDPKSRQSAAKFFRQIIGRVLVSNSMSVEFAKLFSNVYRYVNFAIANELMMVAEAAGQSIYEIIRLVNDGYRRGGLPKPGFAAGPCLPKSALLLPKVKIAPSIAAAAHRLHSRMPRFLVSQMKAVCGGSLKGRRVAILGAAFKKNSDDGRGSLALEAEKLFRRSGCRVSVHDPWLFPSITLKEVLRGSDTVFVGTNHDIYRRLTPRALRYMAGKPLLVCDQWNVFGQGRIFFAA